MVAVYLRLRDDHSIDLQKEGLEKKAKQKIGMKMEIHWSSELDEHETDLYTVLSVIVPLPMRNFEETS